MKVRLYNNANHFSIGKDLVLNLPEMTGPAHFIWTRYQFQNELFGTAQYNCDGVLAVSLTADGAHVAVSYTLEHQGKLLIFRPLPDDAGHN